MAEKTAKGKGPNTRMLVGQKFCHKTAISTSSAVANILHSIQFKSSNDLINTPLKQELRD